MKFGFFLISPSLSTHSVDCLKKVFCGEKSVWVLGENTNRPFSMYENKNLMKRNKRKLPKKTFCMRRLKKSQRENY